MNINLKLFIVITFTVCIAISCEQNTVSPEHRTAVDIKSHGNLEFVYQVTDLEGNPDAVFREGENFLLNFIVKNSSNEVKVIGNEFFTLTDDFFAVYQAQGEGKVYVGKPFDMGVNTKEYREQPIPSGQQIMYVVPWYANEGDLYQMPDYSGDETGKRNCQAIEVPALAKGEYSSGFTLEYKEQLIELEITFTVN